MIVPAVVHGWHSVLRRLAIFQAQLELLDLAVGPLGLATELQAPQLGDRQLEVFDLGGAVVPSPSEQRVDVDAVLAR